MKILFTTMIVALLFTACKQTKSPEDTAKASETTQLPAVLAADAPKMVFTKETYDFGVITQGEQVQYDFKFKNTGKTPLIISNATATCGCTVPEYPTTPIKPGEEGVIKVVFNSEGKMGVQDKVVTITSNAVPSTNELHLLGEIKTK